MQKLLRILLGLICLCVLVWLLAIQYFNNGGKQPDNTVWQSYIGRDTTVGILPDQYANYFTYTLARTNKNTGFRIKGSFPDTRYFSFNVYSLGDNTTQGSLVDYQIQTDSGKPNPFLVDEDSADVGKDFTVHIVPTQFENKDLSNVLTFRDDVKLMTMVIRMYDYNVDDFGGVPLPTVEAFTLEEETEVLSLEPVNLPRALDLRWIVRRRSLPGMVERLGLVFETEKSAPLDAHSSSKEYYSIPFHAIDTKGYIENNDNRYLLAAITKAEGEVFVFKFKSPTFTSGPENINQTDLRYWSFNLGNAATYNFNALKDEDALLDEHGYVHIVMAAKDPAVEKVARELGCNFLEWNMPWKKGLILFRHMLADPTFEAQIDQVPPISKEMNDFTPIEAQKVMGDFAPHGLRMSTIDFLNHYSVQQKKIELK